MEYWGLNPIDIINNNIPDIISSRAKMIDFIFPFFFDFSFVIIFTLNYININDSIPTTKQYIPKKCNFPFFKRNTSNWSANKPNIKEIRKENI